ncbi:hypothetical protein WP50_28295, partial [Lactiplantibacillus plantarum]
MKMSKHNDNYQYPLDETWTTAEISVGPADVRAFVVGTAATHLISWSRSYIGPAPVMTYLANQDISFGMDEMSAATEQIDDPTIV